MEIQALRRRDQLLVGFTLFSMFFGAGNLIFPPQLGAQAGVDTWFAMAGLAVSAVFLPILGVIAVVRAGSLTELASRVHPAFATVFTVLIYLSIGPCLAIPRTASTSFEMAVPPFLPSGTPTMWFQFGYSLLFFAAAFLVALQPEKLTGRLGKFLCPVLLLLVGAMFVGSLVHPVGTYGPTLPPYDQIPAVQGFLTGYQTMDTIAALNFGIVIVMNIRALGVTDQGSVLRATVRAGGIATVLFLAVYSMLAHIGALSGAAFPGMTNGAVTLTNLVGAIFGHWGTVILAAIFFIACFNTCVGLCSATSFLRNWDSILEKKRANLRSISEPARLRQPPPRSTGAAHARGRAQSIREERRIAAPPVLFALLWVRLLPALYGPFCGPLRPFGGCPWGVTPPARECLPPAPPDTRRRG